MVLYVRPEFCHTVSISVDVVERFFLPYSGASQAARRRFHFEDFVGGKGFPRVKDLGQGMFTDRGDQSMDMVCRNDKLVYSISRALKMTQRIVDDLFDFGQGEDARSTAGVKPLLQSLRKFFVIFVTCDFVVGFRMLFQPFVLLSAIAGAYFEAERPPGETSRNRWLHPASNEVTSRKERRSVHPGRSIAAWWQRRPAAVGSRGATPLPLAVPLQLYTP
jgi:hypothetical protein